MYNNWSFLLIFILHIKLSTLGDSIKLKYRKILLVIQVYETVEESNNIYT